MANKSSSRLALCHALSNPQHIPSRLTWIQGLDIGSLIQRGWAETCLVLLRGKRRGNAGATAQGPCPSWRTRGQKGHHGGSSERVPGFPPGVLGRATCGLGGPQNLAQDLCFGRHFVRHPSGVRSWKSVSFWFISNMQLPRIIDRDLSYVFWSSTKTRNSEKPFATRNQISIANLSEHGMLALVSRLHVAHLRFGSLHSKCWLKNFYLQIYFYSLWSKDFSSGQSFP